MSSYKFTLLRSGEECKVRFYPTGIFTITDKRGEHEVGMWCKRQHLYRGKLYNSGGFEAKMFEGGRIFFEFRQRELARNLLWQFIYCRNRDYNRR